MQLFQVQQYVLLVVFFHMYKNGVFVSVQLARCHQQQLQYIQKALLDLRYFLQRDVYGDNPLTSQIEPSIPFTLAVMVTNIGNGIANNMQITSSQPTVIDNQKGNNYFIYLF